PGDYASIENSIGMVYNELSKSQNKKDNLLKAINYFNNALKRISDKSQTIFSNINTNLGISHWRLSSIQNKNQNLNTAITFLEEAQKNIDSKNKPNEYIKIQYYFAKIYSDLSKENPKKYLKLAINAYKNVSEQKKVHNIHIFPFTDKYIGESYHELYKIENTKEHLENALKYIENAKLIMNKENYNSLTTILQEKLALFKEKNHKIGLQEFTKPDSLKGDDKKLKKEIDETKENIKKIEDKNIVETKLFVLNPGPLSIKITSINIKSADGVKSYDLSINVDPGKKELIFNTMTGKQFTWTVYVKPEGSLIEFEK
ncbi:MAG: hypothetical protein OEV44_08965, partial [Spirochaetota bacterium]|nr:hypothetical protein [Spirochaetota bacterium]